MLANVVENLETVLNQYGDLEATVADLESRNLALIIERDDALEKNASNEKMERAASRAVALENKVTRLVFEVERLRAVNGKLEAEHKELKKLNPQKLKEQIKNIKSKNIEWQARCKQLLNDNKSYRKDEKRFKQDIAVLKTEAESNVARLVKSRYIHRVMDDCQIMYWPVNMSVSRNGGKRETIHSVLVMNPYGVGGFFTVKDGVLEFPHCVRDAFDSTEMPSQRVMDFVETWLGKVEAQDYHYTEADLLVFAGRKQTTSLMDEDSPFDVEIEDIINEINGENCSWD